MCRLRFVPIVMGALALHAAVLASQRAPTLRTLASFSGDSVRSLDTSPNGRFVVQSTASNLRMYDVATRQSWTLADGPVGGLNWSPRGDMIAYTRPGDDGSVRHVWVMPVDGKTGKARGPAQRVTVGQGQYPSFSLDGRFIAFSAHDSGAAAHLSIVPVTGGPERVLAHFPGGFESIYWSANGGSIYLNLWTPKTNLRSQMKVRVDDGAVQVIRSKDEWIAGMTADRRHLVLVPAEDRVSPGSQATIIDTTGREVGHVPLPAGDRVNYGEVLGDSALIWHSITDRTLLEMRPVTGGKATRLPLIGESNDDPRWSPDGKQIAFQVREGQRASLAVMNADGTKPRVFRETDVLPNSYGFRWSPDSRFAAFSSPDRHKLSVLDVANGTSHTILEDTTQSIGTWQWRANGQAIVLVSLHSLKVYGPLCADDPICRPPIRGSIDEVGVNGQRRRLLDWPIVNPAPTGFQFVGGVNAFVRTDSTAYLQPFAGEPVRQFGDVPPRTRLLDPVVSNDLRWIAGLKVNVRPPENNQVELFSLETGAKTVLDLPFALNPFGQRLEFVPKDNSLLVFGQRKGGTGLALYRVPLNGDAPTLFVDAGVARSESYFSAVSASPDGRMVVYPVQPEPSTWSLVLINLRGAVPGSGSRTPRP
jgi:dipeptidyl aminopeptidase/acylaminoacyl peptidase